MKTTGGFSCSLLLCMYLCGNWFYQEDCGDLVRLEDILSSYPIASKGCITVMIVLATCSQAAICNTQMCCLINVVTCCLRCLT